MSIRNRVTVAVVWILSLIGVAVWAQGNPQAPPKAPGRVIVEPSRGQYDGPVITGENIGFRRVITPSDKPGKVTGTMVVKIDGQWLEVVPMVGITR